MTISFHTTKADTDTIIKIAHRASDLAEKHDLSIVPMDFLMDVSATHVNGCPLDLDSLLTADDVNFTHDVFGIRRHINRTTGALGDCFLPRYSA